MAARIAGWTVALAAVLSAATAGFANPVVPGVVSLECLAVDGSETGAVVTGDPADPASFDLDAFDGDRRWTVQPSVFHPDAARLEVRSVTGDTPFLRAELAGPAGEAVSLRLAEMPGHETLAFAGVLVLPGEAHVVTCADLFPALAHKKTQGGK